MNENRFGNFLIGALAALVLTDNKRRTGHYHVGRFLLKIVAWVVVFVAAWIALGYVLSFIFNIFYPHV